LSAVLPAQEGEENGVFNVREQAGANGAAERALLVVAFLVGAQVESGATAVMAQATALDFAHIVVTVTGQVEIDVSHVMAVDVMSAPPVLEAVAAVAYLVVAGEQGESPATAAVVGVK
jgi:hypothetical protein